MTGENVLSLADLDRPGLILVDLVKGFCSPGWGNLAPKSHDPAINAMVAECNRLAQDFTRQKRPVFAFLDTHDPDRPEPPYPPHCIRGSGEENLVEPLEWLREAENATLHRKDCINAYIGAIDPDTAINRLAEWIDQHQLSHLIVCGICTDICVLDTVVTLLSARNHGLIQPVQDVIVPRNAVATYDLPLEEARTQGLPDSAAHPQTEAQHTGLWVMAARGARIEEYVDTET